MNRSVSDQQVEILFFEGHTCPECGYVCSPVDGCHDRSPGAQWQCGDEDDCGKVFTVRELVENALRRAGMLLKVVEPDPPPDRTEEHLDPAG